MPEAPRLQRVHLLPLSWPVARLTASEEGEGEGEGQEEEEEGQEEEEEGTVCRQPVEAMTAAQEEAGSRPGSGTRRHKGSQLMFGRACASGRS